MQVPASSNYRFLLAGGVISELGDWSARLALGVLVFQETDSTVALGLMTALLALPWLGLGQWLAVRAGRLDRRRLLVAADGIRGVIFLIIGLSELSVPAIFALVLLAATIDPVFEANRSAMVVDVLPTEDYADGIQVIHVISQSAQLIGFGLGGVLAGAIGAQEALAINATTFFLSALLISRVKTSTESEQSGGQASLSQAVAFLKSDRLSLVAVVVTFITVAAAMSIESQAAAFGLRVAGLGEMGVGLLAATVPAASLIVISRLDTRGSDRTLSTRGLRITLVAAWLAVPLLLVAEHVPLTFAAYAFTGAVFLYATVGNIVVGRRIPNDVRVGVFGVLQAAVYVATSVGAISGGVASDLFGSKPAASGAMLLAAGVCLCGLWAVSRSVTDGRSVTGGAAS